jgi:O-antigen ligase
MQALDASHKNTLRNFWLLAVTSLLCFVGGFFIKQPLVALVPFAIAFACIALADVRLVYYTLILLIPPSVNLLEWGYISIDVPDEPLMIACTLATPFLYLHNRQSLPIAVLWRTTLVSAVTVFFLWAVVCSITSTNVVTSVKFTLAKLWYILPFFFFTLALVYHNPRVLGLLLKLLMLSLVPMIIIVTLRHRALGYSFEDVNEATSPFWRNHVLYGSMMSMCIPLLVGALWLTKRFTARWFLLVVCLIASFVAVYLAYSRGAWAAVFASAAVYIALRVKLLKIGFIAFVLTLFAAVAFLSSKNKFLDFAPRYESGIMHDNLADHLIATIKGKDISSNERFYRWVAAVRMSQERPVFGVGPNCFYDYYKPHAVTVFRTYVSRNDERSTTHNYFLFMLVEQGIPGMLLYAILMYLAFATCQRLYFAYKGDKYTSTVILSMAAMLGAFFINNFLSELVENDKLGSMFFIALGTLAALDIRLRYQGSTKSSSASLV